MPAPAPAGARRIRLIGVALAAALGVGGCGPVTSTTRIADATVAVEAAQAVQADRYAVFEYVSAVEYLKKAKEEEGFSDFQAAIDLATRARELAEKARQRALANPARGLAPPEAPVDEDLPNEDLAPATGMPSGSSL